MYASIHINSILYRNMAIYIPIESVHNMYKPYKVDFVLNAPINNQI